MDDASVDRIDVAGIADYPVSIGDSEADGAAFRAIGLQRDAGSDTVGSRSPLRSAEALPILFNRARTLASGAGDNADDEQREQCGSNDVDVSVRIHVAFLSLGFRSDRTTLHDDYLTLCDIGHTSRMNQCGAKAL